MQDLFFLKCVDHIHGGLTNGLTRFSGPSRAALVYAMGKDGPVHVYDPHELLRGHEPRLRELYLKDGSGHSARRPRRGRRRCIAEVST